MAAVVVPPERLWTATTSVVSGVNTEQVAGVANGTAGDRRVAVSTQPAAGLISTSALVASSPLTERERLKAPSVAVTTAVSSSTALAVPS